MDRQHSFHETENVMRELLIRSCPRNFSLSGRSCYTQFLDTFITRHARIVHKYLKDVSSANARHDERKATIGTGQVQNRRGSLAQYVA